MGIATQVKSYIVFYIIFWSVSSVLFSNNFEFQMDFNIPENGVLTLIEGTHVNFKFNVTYNLKNPKHLIKIDTFKNETLTITDCRFYVDCSKTIYNKTCRCLFPGGPYQFTKTVHRSDDKAIYMWLAEDKNFNKHAQRNITFNVTYPSRVTKLIVDNEGGSSVHAVLRNQSLTVVCHWENGNPPTIPRILDSEGKYLKNTTVNRAQVIGQHSVLHCNFIERIRCEADGSARNMSTTVLTKCPPEFSNASVGLQSVNIGENAVFRFQLYAHTTAITKCQITQLTERIMTNSSAFVDNHDDDNRTKHYAYECDVHLTENVMTNSSAFEDNHDDDNGTKSYAYECDVHLDKHKCWCHLTGTVPNFTLHLNFQSIIWKDCGLWSVNVSNEIGSDTKEFSIKIIEVTYDNEESTSKKDLSPESQSNEASSDSESDQTEIKTMTGLFQDVAYDNKESASKKVIMSYNQNIEASSDSESDQTEIKIMTGLLQEIAYDNKENTSKKDLISDSKSKEASSDSESDQTEIKTMTGLLQENSSTRVDDDDISDDDSAGVDAGTDDNTSGEFSDNEKQDVEESEKKQTAYPRDPEHPLELSLRAYQLELAAPALEGHNTIICAPTGSGKTRVALHIVQKHLEANGMARKKVVFLARTVPLVTQQHRNFQKYLPNYKSVLVTGESKFNMHLHSLLPKHDIFVLTPKILENHLVPEKIPSLAAFSLLIFDECHHTRKEEPYNSLMKSYLKSKKDGKEHLPQIVGLTASIGVEKATIVTEAVESILGIMGNLDVSCISVVKQNLQELQDTVPVPKEEFVNLVSREGDEVSRKIENIMHQIEEMLKNSGSQLHDSVISKLLESMPTNCREQQYRQWAVNLRNQIRLLKFDDSQKSEQRKRFARDVQVLSGCLIAYNEALDVHDLTRPQDVLDYLNKKIRKLSTDTESKEFGYFTVLRKMLMKHTNEENPNLKILAETIKEHLKTEGEESQIIIFVQRRATCHALCKWLNSDTEKDLKQLGAAAFTGMGVCQEDGGMTLPGQEGVIQRFRIGDVKLLVTTSVGEEGIDIPECNLVIKYNHVGNEVTTVQTRGRSRKKGGRSILMAKPKFIRKEMLNQERAKMMYEAIEQVKQMSPDSIEAAVHQVQKKIMESEEIKASVQETKKMSKCKEPFFLECSGLCNKLRVKGEYVRTINKSHHVIIGHQYDEQVVLQSKKHRCIDDVIFTGSFKCKECKNHLGQIVNYKQVQFMSIGLGSWIVLNKDNDRMTCKRWKNVPYQIEELSPADIKMHHGKHDNGCVGGSNPEEGAIGGAGE